MRAAIEEYGRGIRSPVVCRKYGISERTLYRWTRSAGPQRRTEEGTGTPPSPDGEAFYRMALCIVVRALPAAERERVARALATRLHLSREGVERLLDGSRCAPEWLADGGAGTSRGSGGTP